METLQSIRILALLCLVAGCAKTPSEAEVRSCYNSPDIERVTFGKSFKSQGGFIEQSLGAPNGTVIFPTIIRIRYSEGDYDLKLWVFNDSFKRLNCPIAPDNESGI
jgi:hypothetical protein